MFTTSAQAMIIIALEFFAGCVIGLVVVAHILRSQLRLGVALRGAAIAGLALLLMSGLTGRLEPTLSSSTARGKT
jgi:hypothetical protein